MICRICKQDKPSSREHFPIDRGKLRYECKPCFARIARERRAKLTSDEKYQINLRYRSIQVRWRNQNREYVREYQKLYIRNKRRTDLQTRVASNTRGRLRDALKAKGLIKSYKTAALIGCDFKTLRDYIRSHYRPGMTDDNQGQFWEIDHVIPLSAFNLADPEELKAAAHYTNIRPLEKALNRTKGGTNRHPREFYLQAIEAQVSRVGQMKSEYGKNAFERLETLTN